MSTHWRSENKIGFFVWLGICILLLLALLYITPLYREIRWILFITAGEAVIGIIVFGLKLEVPFKVERHVNNLLKSKTLTRSIPVEDVNYIGGQLISIRLEGQLLNLASLKNVSDSALAQIFVLKSTSEIVVIVEKNYSTLIFGPLVKAFG